MNLFYCEQCHTLIREADIASGAAVVAGEERYLCPSCNAKKTQHPAIPAPVPAPAPAPAATVIPAPPSAKFSAASTAHIKIPRETRETARGHAHASSKARPAPPSEKNKNAGGPSLAALGGGAGALLVLMLIFFSMSKGKPTPPKPDPTKTVVVTPPDTTTTPDPAPLTNTQTPPTNTQTTVTQTNQGTVVPPPLDMSGTQPATGEDSPRERMARREFDAIKTWGQEHASEPYEYIVRLSEFQFRNRTNRMGKEAEKLAGEIKAPSRVDQTLARWTLDDSDATSGIALKGKAHITGGHVGRGAVALSGDNEDYVELGGDPALNIAASAPFSIAGWFRTAADYGMLVSLRNSKLESTVVDIAVGNHGGANAPGVLMALVRQDNGTSRYASVVGGKVNDNAWHHFALTRNNAGLIRLYLDGVFQASHVAPDSGGALTTDLRGLGMELYWLRIPAQGKPPQASGFKGEIDDVRMYGIALTDPEIRDLVTRKL